MAISEIEMSAISVMIEAIKIAMTEEIATNNATIAIIGTKTTVAKGKIVHMLQIKTALKRIKDHALILKHVQQL